jgi:hypothetical protein
VAVRRLSTLIVALIVLATDVSSAQQLRLRIRSASSSGSGGAASNPIDAARLPPSNTWETAGASSITDVRTRCTTGTGTSVIAAYTGTAATINTAISGCDAGHYVELGAGTFTLSTGIAARTNNVTLKGQGAQGVASGGTFLDINNDCGDIYAAICVKTSNDTDSGTLQNTGTLSGTFTKGQTTLTLTRATGSTAPVVGAVVVFDQANDSTTDTNEVWVCSTASTCADEGGGGNSRTVGGTKYGTQQVVRLTSVTGTGPWAIAFTPGLISPVWSSSKTPGAWWTDQTAVTGIGLEDFELDGAGVTGTCCGNIIFQNATNSWVKGVKSRFGARFHVRFQQSNYITVRDSYFDEDQDHASQAYGLEWFAASMILAENNILHHVTLPIALNETGSGSVIAYNYLIDNTYSASATFMIAGYGLHEKGVEMILFEGNIGPGFISDDIHGTHQFVTVFRNRFIGLESGKTQQTNPIKIYKYGRFYNLLGNVLGDNTYHANYATGNDTSIYHLDSNGCTSGCASAGLVASTLFRWGNYDTVNDANTFSSGEVPSGLSLYAQPVPSSQTLPNSLYLSAKPSFFNASTSNTWPGIGPEVTGGDLSGLNGHAYTNPAKKCYDTLTKDGNGQITNFSRVNCGY